MESFCNNHNSVNCVRNNSMHSYDGHVGRCNSVASNRECMTQQRRREECMGQNQRETRIINQLERENRNHHRNVEVECVCQVTSTADCHRHDEMEHLGCEFPLVMSYVPWQQWGDMYEAECGLMQGTIFKDLNFIFCGERC